MPITIDNINQMPRAEFIKTFANVIEHSPWIAEQLWDNYLPFDKYDSLYQSLLKIINNEGEQVWKIILNLHPELSGKEAEDKTLTEFSASEQSRLGLDCLSADEFKHMRDFNQQYRKKFDFPFVVCVGLLKNKEDLFTLQATRINNTIADELHTGITQVGEIARLRIETLFQTKLTSVGVKYFVRGNVL